MPCLLGMTGRRLAELRRRRGRAQGAHPVQRQRALDRCRAAGGGQAASGSLRAELRGLHAAADGQRACCLTREAEGAHRRAEIRAGRVAGDARWRDVVLGAKLAGCVPMAPDFRVSRGARQSGAFLSRLSCRRRPFPRCASSWRSETTAASSMSRRSPCEANRRGARRHHRRLRMTERGARDGWSHRRCAVAVRRQPRCGSPSR